jgi:protein KTI12
MDPNTLYALEKRTSEIISAIRTFTLSHPTITSAVAAGDTEDGFSISVPNTESRVVVPSHVLTASSTEELAGAGGLLALPRLQRLRRQWVGLNRALVGGRGPSQSAMTPERVGDAFVRFLNAEFEGMSGDLS